MKSVCEAYCNNMKDVSEQLANQLQKESIDFAFKNEDFLQPVFDCFLYYRMVRNRVRVANPELGAPELI